MLRDLRGIIPAYEIVQNDEEAFLIAAKEIGKAIYDEVEENIGENNWIVYFSNCSKATGYPIDFFRQHREDIVGEIMEHIDGCDGYSVWSFDDNFDVILPWAEEDDDSVFFE